MNIFDSESNLVFLIIAGGLIILSVLLSVLNKNKAKESSSINFNSYHLKKSLLTKNEIEFYETLNKVVKDDLIIFSMVRLADIFSIDKGKGFQSSLNRINSRHVDFLLCQKETLQPVLAIELDDKSHERSDRINRDEFVNQLFDSAGLPLLRYRSKNHYNPDDIKDKLNPVLMGKNNSSM